MKESSMKRTHSRNFITLTIVFVTILSMVCGCALTASAEAFDPKSITDGVSLTIAVKENIRVEDYNTNDMKKQIEDALGVSLEFMVLPSADYETKLNLMIAGGDVLPDIIFSPASDKVDSWVQEGVLLPLNEYYDDANMSANIRTASESEGVDIATYMTSPDGNIYKLPAFSPSPNGTSWKKMWVYKPWLDQLGKEVPQTLDEYYEVLKLIASTDLNGNGKADEIGLTGTGIYTYTGPWFEFLMSSFIYAYDDEFRVLENGEISFAYDTDLWKEGLTFIKKLFDEKLIPIETLTQSEEQYKAMLNSESTTVFSYTYFNPDMLNADLMDRKLEYTYINALTGPHGLKESMNYPSLPGVGAVITVDCKDPAAAFLVCDYMCSEAFGISQRFGTQGVDWDYMDDAKVNKSDYAATNPSMEPIMLAYDDSAFWSSGIIQNRSFMLTGPYVKPLRTVGGGALNIASTDLATAQKTQYQQLYAASSAAGVALGREETVTYLPLTMDEINSISEAKATLKTYLTEAIASFLVGTKDIENDWDAYINELNVIGYKTILETYQNAYDRTYK